MQDAELSAKPHVTFGTTLPVALPFLFMTDVGLALRTSNATAVVLLFVARTGLAKHILGDRTERRPVRCSFRGDHHRSWRIGSVSARRQERPAGDRVGPKAGSGT